MTMMFGIIVFVSMLAFSPFMARHANPINVKTPNPMPKPRARPCLESPSSAFMPSKAIVCPSTEVVEMHLSSTLPAFPTPLAFFLLIDTLTGVPFAMTTVPSFTTSSSTTTTSVPLLALLLITLPRSKMMVVFTKGHKKSCFPHRGKQLQTLLSYLRKLLN